GYRFFKDVYTGKLHNIWTKSQAPLEFDENTDIVPLNLSNNPNHEIVTSLSRRNILNHYRSIIEANSQGLALGNNSYRWTDKNPVTGATIIDAEGSLLLN